VKKTTTVGLMSVLVVMGAEARAQQATLPGSAFLSLNVGAQPQRRTIQTSETFPLYDEAAVVTSSQPIKNGAMLDITGGYRGWRRLALAVGLSSFSSSGSSTLTASIPDPGFFDRPRTVVQNATGLERRELGVHLQAVWFLPIADRVDIAFSAGPSIIRVRQQLTAGVTVPPRTQSVNVVQETQSGTALGANAGFDMSYMFTPRYGAGVFLRYAGASIDLPAVPSLKAGGVQGGFGFRARF
jgi:hypothetical protein